MVIGIIGQGFVGNAVFQKFKNFFKVLTYDTNNDLSNSTINEIKNKCKIVFVCVPTPMNADGSCDTKIVESVIEIFKDIKGLIIVNKSTIPPGTTDIFNERFKKISIVFNPEFLTEKNAIQDFENQNRIILGGVSDSIKKLKKLYSIIFPKSTILLTSAIQAELVKYFTNCFLATKVSFANEMNQLCKKLKVDYSEIVKIVLHDKRIGKSHLEVPGHDGDFGYGGHCLPKDLSALISLTEDVKSINNVLRSVKTTNDIVRNNRDWEKMLGRAVSLPKKT